MARDELLVFCDWRMTRMEMLFGKNKRWSIILYFRRKSYVEFMWNEQFLLKQQL
jgi:hypothetical protein